MGVKFLNSVKVLLSNPSAPFKTYPQPPISDILFTHSLSSQSGDSNCALLFLTQLQA